MSYEDLSKRHFLKGLLGAGALGTMLTAPKIFVDTFDLPPSERLIALSKPAPWTVAYENAPKGGFSPKKMKLITGTPPLDLKGSLYRNGPGQFHYGDSVTGHLFDGDGIIHRLAFENGEITHAGQFVDTPKRRAEQAAQGFLAPGFGTLGSEDYPMVGPDDANAANTSVMMVNDELYALWEGGSAWQIDVKTLNSIGPKAWSDETQQVPFSAHPKVDPSGRVFNVGQFGNKVMLWDISAEGKLNRFEMIQIEAASYIHDFAMTERHILILLQPYLYTRNMPPFINSFEWKPEEDFKVLIIDKDDFSSRRWSAIPAKFFFHTGDAYEDKNGDIYFDVCLYDEPAIVTAFGMGTINHDYDRGDAAPPTLSLVKLPARGDGQIDATHLVGEFPRIDPRFQGVRRGDVWMAGGAKSGRPGETQIIHQNWETGKSAIFDFGPLAMVEEPVFVPGHQGRDYIICTSLNLKAHAHQAHVFDAYHISAGPLASWQADYYWPLGFHGIWAS